MRFKTRRVGKQKYRISRTQRGGTPRLNIINPILSYMNNANNTRKNLGEITQHAPNNSLENNNMNLNDYTQNKFKNSFLTRTRKSIKQLPFFRQTPFTDINVKVKVKNLHFNNSKSTVQYYPINNTSRLEPTPKRSSHSKPINENILRHTLQNDEYKYIKNALVKNAHTKATILSKHNSFKNMENELMSIQDYHYNNPNPNPNKYIDSEIRKLAYKFANVKGAVPLTRIIQMMKDLPIEKQNMFLLEYRRLRVLIELMRNTDSK